MRTLLFVPALALSGGLGAGCPRTDDAPPRPAAALTPAPAPATTHAARPVARLEARAAVSPTPLPAAQTDAGHVDPALYTSLPPELVDDGSDDVVAEPEPAPEPAPVPEPSRRPEVPELASIGKETWIFAEPRWASRRIGYLRAGAIVERSKKPSGFSSCEEGWYRIAPKGYVCNGSNATLDVHHAVVEASSRRPGRETLPYTYVMSRFPTPPLYGRLPSEEEQSRIEPDLTNHLQKLLRTTLKDPSYVEPPPAEATPASLLYGRPAPGLAGAPRTSEALVLGRARARSGFALLSTFDHDERRFGLTTELAVIPLDRTRVIRPSTFSGLSLDEQRSLPVAFIKTRHAVRYRSEGTGGFSRGEPLAWREAVPLASGVRRGGGSTFLETKDGTWVRADQVVRVDRFKQAPAWATQGRKWIDVSILRQTLTAYDGLRPVYTTLVSTGADGLGDPKKTHSTVQGAFLIHTKHVTVTMDGDDAGDEFDLRDVPFVQYFTDGFALHGAYWHDDFGTPRSHGCINLAPIDAAWLFNWTSPEVPGPWHAALTLKRGTLVYTHP